MDYIIIDTIFIFLLLFLCFFKSVKNTLFIGYIAILIFFVVFVNIFISQNVDFYITFSTIILFSIFLGAPYIYYIYYNDSLDNNIITESSIPSS